MAEQDQTTEQNIEPKSLSLLAQEYYGSAYHGEVKEAEQPAAPPAEETAADPSEAVTDGTPADPPAEENPDEVTISSLTELVQHNEWDPEWVNTLKVPVKVDGKEGEATLADLVASYQQREMAERYKEEAHEAAKAAKQEAAEKARAFEGQLSVAAKLIDGAERLLNAEVSAVDWQDLRDNDPAEYAAKKAEIAERRKEIDEMKRQGLDALEAHRNQTSAMTEEEMREALAAEQAALLEKLPEWRDSEKAKAEKAEIVNDLIDRGFSREDVFGASDHRLILLARDALNWRKSQSSNDAARKKVAKVPKVLKPGAPKPQDQQRREQTETLRARLRETGSLDDAFRLLKAG